MPQRDVLISTPDGTCDATLHTPAGSGPWPAVIMFPDAGGVRDTFHVMAQRLADLGYAVLLPNIYYRAGAYEPFDLTTVFTVPEERDRLMSLAGSVTKKVAARDTGRRCCSYSRNNPRSATPRWGRRATASGVDSRSTPPDDSLTAWGRQPRSTGATSRAPRPTALTCSLTR